MAERELPDHPVVVGVAVRSVEAWTLGAPDALAKVLRIEPSQIKKSLSGRAPESISPGVAKQILGEIAKLGGESDSTALRERAAEQTEISVLARACEQGFAPFAEEVRKKLLGPLEGDR